MAHLDVIKTVNRMAEERKLDVSKLTQEQRLLPSVVSKVYYLLKKEGKRLEEKLGYRVEEFTKFRQDLFEGEVEPCLSVTQLLVANLFIENENMPISCTRVKEKIGITSFSPDVKYRVVKENIELVKKKVICSDKNYNLIEAIQYYPSLEDSFSHSPVYSRAFLGTGYSLEALSEISKTFDPYDFLDILRKFKEERTEKIRKVYPKGKDREFRERLLERASIMAVSWAYPPTKV